MVRIPEQANCDAVAAGALANLMESSEARMALPEMSQIEVRGLGHCSSASIRNWFLRREPWAQ